MDSVRWLDEREVAAWRGLQDMHTRLAAQLARELAASSNLSYADYQVLVVLTEHPSGRLRPCHLAGRLGWERSRLSHHLTRMAERGLVVKERCDQDRRGALVAVTGEGRRAIGAAAPGHVAAVRRLFVDRLSAQQLDHLAEVSRVILDGLDGCPDEESGKEAARAG